MSARIGSDLCDHSDTFIVFKGTIAVTRANKRDLKK